MDGGGKMCVGAVEVVTISPATCSEPWMFLTALGLLAVSMYLFMETIGMQRIEMAG